MIRYKKYQNRIKALHTKKTEIQGTTLLPGIRGQN